MHTFIKNRNEPLWTVGHYKLVGEDNGASHHTWVPMKDFNNEEAAARYVNYLNGGKY